MATPERDTVYTNDGATKSVYTRESSSTGWFVGIIVALALLAIGYLVFSANSGPAVVDNSTTTLTTPAAEPATPDVAPMTEAPAPAVEPAPMTEAPAVDTAPAMETAPATETPATPAPAEPAPVTTTN